MFRLALTTLTVFATLFALYGWFEIVCSDYSTDMHVHTDDMNHAHTSSDGSRNQPVPSGSGRWSASPAML